MKCKGCDGQVAYETLTMVKEKGEKDPNNAGAALTHYPADYCTWFETSSNAEILAYLNVAEYKARQAII